CLRELVLITASLLVLLKNLHVFERTIRKSLIEELFPIGMRKAEKSRSGVAAGNGKTNDIHRCQLGDECGSSASTPFLFCPLIFCSSAFSREQSSISVGLSGCWACCCRVSK
ncbi:hypothetical protein PMAYCL1PPCAC_27459, partial [Pristionchus mayeri]